MLLNKGFLEDAAVTRTTGSITRCVGGDLAGANAHEPL